jgi:SAM-dependent methyltransferase
MRSHESGGRRATATDSIASATTRRENPDGFGLFCLVCGGKYQPSSLPGLFQCQSCGFISADLNIPDDELRELYGEDYFHGQEYLDYVAEEESLRLNFRNRLATLRSMVSAWSKADLFEVGCAYGFFLDEIKAQVGVASGIDISADAVRYAVGRFGVDARCGDYLHVGLERQVDVIVMWDTIEHLKRPDLFVQKIGTDLKPGGVLAITTGDIGSWNARLRGAAWRMIHPPTHLHYFSVSTLSALLGRNGFEVVHVGHPGNSRRIRSVLGFIFALKMRRPKLYASMANLPLTSGRITVNLYDIMFVVARKRSQ